MTYLELKQAVSCLQKQIGTEEKLKVTVISDMPLQPWFDLYLEKAGAEKGRLVRIERVLWQQRNEKATEQAEVRIYWPSNDVAEEIDADTDAPGIWISIEKASDPMELFYAERTEKKNPIVYPKGSNVIDLEKLMLRLGIKESLAVKEKRWGDRYSQKLQELTAYEVVRCFEMQQGRRKKCLVLDCDGVLWGGIISEDGLSGIELAESGKGQLYRNFQKVIKRLNEHGIIVALCSKNNEEDVTRVFRDHTAMVLKEEDIAAWSVNWKPKSSQMAQLAAQLNIDLQDMVFVDDNQWELEEVRSQHPQVTGILFDPLQGEWAIYDKLAAYFWLSPKDKNHENQLRIQTYADNVKRETLKANSSDYEDFLEKLQTQVNVQPASVSDLPRISDLSRRANQCTNGTRYTVEELQSLVSSGYQLQAVFVSDIYRDLGLVGCIGIQPENESLDLFCLSCRALGRKIENGLLAALPPEVKKIRWQDTGKNAALGEIIRASGRWQNEA